MHEGKEPNYVEVSDLLESEIHAGDISESHSSVRERLKRRGNMPTPFFNISVGTVDGLLTIAAGICKRMMKQSEWVKDLQQTLEMLRAKVVEV